MTISDLFLNIRGLDEGLSLQTIESLSVDDLERLTLALDHLHDRVSCAWREKKWPAPKGTYHD